MDNNVFKYTTVIMRKPSNSLAAEALRREESTVNIERAKRQWKEISNIWKDQLGLKVIVLDADESLPDGVFVEDTAVVIGRTGLITTPGHPSRRREAQVMAETLRSFPDLHVFIMEEMQSDARMDGGDVLFTGKEIFVGISQRTNILGMEVLRKVFDPIPVSRVEVSGALHLKSVCSLASPGKIAVCTSNESAKCIVQNIREAAKESYEYIDVPGKACGSNCIYVETTNGPVVVYQSATELPHTKEVYESFPNCKKFAVDLTELGKVDGCLTCSSLFLSL